MTPRELFEVKKLRDEEKLKLRYTKGQKSLPKEQQFENLAPNPDEL